MHDVAEVKRDVPWRDLGTLRLVKKGHQPLLELVAAGNGWATIWARLVGAGITVLGFARWWKSAMAATRA